MRIRLYNLRLFCRFAVKDKVLFNRFAEQSVFQPLENAFFLGGNDNIAVAFLKQPAIAAREFEAEAVAEAGFDDCRSRAALFHNGCKFDLPPAYARINGIIQRFNIIEIGYAVFVFFNMQLIQFFARAGYHVGNKRGSLCGRKRKGYKRRRNVDILEGAAHGILAAYRAETEVNLRI